MSNSEKLIQLKSIDHSNVSDLEVLFSDGTRDQLYEYFRKITVPGQIDQLSLEEFILNLPRDYYKYFSLFQMAMQQCDYSKEDLCKVVMAVKRVNAVKRQVVYEGVAKRVGRDDKEHAYWAIILMHHAFNILVDATKSPISLSLRGSNRDSNTGLQYPSACGQTDVNRDEILEEALYDLGRRV